MTTRLQMVAAALAVAWAAPAWGEGAQAWNLAGTQATVENTQGGQRLTVTRDGTAPVIVEAMTLIVREPAGQSVTGDSEAQMVVTGWSGSDRCCHTIHIIDLGPTPHLVQSIDAGLAAIDPFMQLDDDPAMEIALPDWSFANWPGSFANSPVPRVILHWDGRQYVPSPKLMRAGTMLYQLHDRLQPDSEEAMLGTVFQDTLDMIYAGRWKAARTLLKQLLPPTPENKRLEQAFFDCKLPSSPWWPFVAGLNNVPAKPPAAGCPAKAG